LAPCNFVETNLRGLIRVTAARMAIQGRLVLRAKLALAALRVLPVPRYSFLPMTGTPAI
jgi:hypothetical protein